MKISTIVSSTAVAAVMLGGNLLLAPPGAQAALHYGPTTQYPSAGGTWEYGFWNAKVRSYYTVNKCHGSSLKLNGSLVRSVDTASGRKSTAEKSAIQTPNAEDSYYYRTC